MIYRLHQMAQELMSVRNLLQKTELATIKGYFEELNLLNFPEKFPTIAL